MSLTPDSAATPYCDPPTFLFLYDNRLVGRLVRNDGTIATPFELLTDPVLAFALASASGDLEAALLVGGRYAPKDLQALTGNSKAMLGRLVAALAFAQLHQIRGIPLADFPQVTTAMDTIERIEKGERILAFVETANAGLPETSNYTPLDIANLDRVSDQASRYFGNRGSTCGSVYGSGYGTPGGSGFGSGYGF